MRHRTHPLMAPALTLGLLLACGDLAAAAGPARLLKDINQTPSWEMGSSPEDYRRFGDLTLFTAWTRQTGHELWRTDGTDAGTFMLKDIWPGPGDGARFSQLFATVPLDIAILGNEAFFMANDGASGWELWKTDGTPAGTRLVREIQSGPAGPFDSRDSRGDATVVFQHVMFGGILYFAANDGVQGTELWRTDGTEAGTYMLRDINPGSKSAFGLVNGVFYVDFLAEAVGGTLFFAADNGLNGRELWKTDGTPAGTVLLRDINPGPAAASPSHMMNLNGSLLFWATGPSGVDPWISDGTEFGTGQVSDLPFNLPFNLPGETLAVNGVVLFTTFQYLWRTDGTPAGTYLIGSFSSGTRFLGRLGGYALVAMYDAAHGVELWRSDGTVAGTSLIKDINPGAASSNIWSASFIGGRAWFTANDGVHGSEIWTSDGTEAGTRMLSDFVPGPAGSNTFLLQGDPKLYLLSQDALGAFWLRSFDAATATPIDQVRLDTAPYEYALTSDGTFLFSADDGIHGDELWKSDGSQSGTTLLKDLNPIYRTDGSSPTVLRKVCVPGVGERALLSAYTGANGWELFVTDGTSSGTLRVQDYRPVPNASTGLSCSPGIDGTYYYVGHDTAHGYELWQSDGTADGTRMVVDLNPGSGDGVYEPPVRYHGALYFSGWNLANGGEIFRSDGTAQGTVVAAETLPGTDTLFPQRLFATDDTLYFVALSPSQDFALWRTDGSQEGTSMVIDPAVGGGPYSIRFVASLAGRVYFTAFGDGLGTELWVSDGTEAGTHVTRDIRQGTGGSVTFPLIAAPLGDSLYFAAFDSAHGRELWKTDGTEAGTVLVKDIWPGTRSSGFTALLPIDGQLYFDAVTSTAFENELWKSDGTEEGTVPYITGLGPNVYNLAAVAGGFLFTALDSEHGQELWRSDGTAQGTGFAQDIAPGTLGSYPGGFVEIGSRVYFTADDGTSGEELWSARGAILMNQPGRAIQDLRKEIRGLLPARGPRTSLLAQLDTAARALSAGRNADAIAALEEFSGHIDDLTPRWITREAAAELRDFAGQTAGLLEEAP
jgi:ELWxxDGT repeat protein